MVEKERTMVPNWGRHTYSAFHYTMIASPQGYTIGMQSYFSPTMVETYMGDIKPGTGCMHPCTDVLKMNLQMWYSTSTRSTRPAVYIN